MRLDSLFKSYCASSPLSPDPQLGARATGAITAGLPRDLGVVGSQLAENGQDVTSVDVIDSEVSFPRNPSQDR